jgi:hypothetical protein
MGHAPFTPISHFDIWLRKSIYEHIEYLPQFWCRSYFSCYMFLPGRVVLLLGILASVALECMEVLMEVRVPKVRSDRVMDNMPCGLHTGRTGRDSHTPEDSDPFWSACRASHPTATSLQSNQHGTPGARHDYRSQFAHGRR